MAHPSAQFSATLRVHLANRPGAFAALAAAVAQHDALLDAIDLVRVENGTKVRDVTVLASDAEHIERIVATVREVDGVFVEHVSDRTFLLHLGGKLEVVPKLPIKTRDDLSMAYTPGVARVSRAIADDPSKVWSLTIKHNTVAVVSDGSAVLGLGDVGPEAALPVMEGKAALFKEFAGIDAFPICLATRDPDEIVRTVEALAPVFGGVNLEDIGSPRCFEIERQLRERLDIPVFHDQAMWDLHAQSQDKTLAEVRIVITGIGAAGISVTKMLLAAGASDVVGCDVHGVVALDYPGLDDVKREYAKLTNPRAVTGTANDALEGADVFIGVSAPGAVTADAIRTMAPDAIVFAMANPNPEVLPEEIEGDVAVVATGRSDYPNQINNVLAFPGVFRGALDAGATRVTQGMKVAAAEAIAAVVADSLSADAIVPSPLDPRVAPAVAAAVKAAAVRDGVIR